MRFPWHRKKEEPILPRLARLCYPEGARFQLPNGRLPGLPAGRPEQYPELRLTLIADGKTFT